MSIVKLDEIPTGIGPSAVSIGVFDGVHIGHQALLAVLRSEARRVGGPAVAMTFDRNPLALLVPEKEPFYINTLDQKLELLEQSGADLVTVLRFDRHLSEMSPAEFVDKILVGHFGAESVVVGTNFRFGRNRSGDLETLRQLGDARGFRVVGVEPAVYQGSAVSSTRVRNAIEKGDVEGAALLLGRPFTLLGEVVSGLGLGRQLGYPTANVDVADRQIVPPNGVYAVEAIIEGSRYVGACSIGVRPTIDGDDRAIEVLIDRFDSDIYGWRIGVAFHSRVREQHKFESLDELKAQIGRDMEAVRGILGRGNEK